MIPVREICDFLHRLAPLDLAEDWDNVGLLIGSLERPVRRLMTCLTITPDTAEEAVREGVDMVVVHHPFPFHATKRITDATPAGRMLLRLIRAEVSVYSAHTAYDSAARGINQQLAEIIGCLDIRPLVPQANGEPGRGAARYGQFPSPRTVVEIVDALRRRVGPFSAQVTRPSERPIRQIAVACGSAGGFVAAACEKGCDALVLGEASFHVCLDAQARDLQLILLGHYASERFAMEQMADRLASQFDGLTVWSSRAESDPLLSL